MIPQKSIDLIIKSAPLLLKGALLTIQIALIAVIIGAIFGTILGVANSRKLRIPFLGYFFDAYVFLIRGTPIYVQILIAYFVFPDLLGINLGPFMAGVLALGLNSIAYVSEIVRAGINSISTGQWEASYALGYNKTQALISVILPQMLRNVLPALTNEFVVLIKETSLIGTIGILELTKVAREINARELDPITIWLAAAAIYLVMTTTVSLIAKKLEKELTYD